MATTPVIVDCARAAAPDVGTIDGLARCCLEARRRGRRMLLRNPTPALLDLIGLAGLDAVLRVEVERQAEEREEPGGVEEERDLGDPAV